MIFLIAEISSQASRSCIPEDDRFLINTKIARRVFKLKANTVDFVRARALSVCEATSKDIARVWETIQQEAVVTPSTIDDSVIEQDTALSLQMSRSYLNSILAADAVEPEIIPTFNLQCKPWITEYQNGLPDVSCFNTTEDDLLFVLAEFEAWVSRSLGAWSAQKAESLSESDCVEVAALTREYQNRAMLVYNNVPEQLSIMVLTIMELWRTLDTMVITLLPLLGQFSPEIPSTFFDPLLFSKLEEMQRLREIEKYVENRLYSADQQKPSVFSDPCQKSFTVAFYNLSNKHQDLRKVIEDDALVKKAEKKREWEEKTRQFQALGEKASGLTCSVTYDRDGQRQHAAQCEKCELERARKEVVIGQYEWPLPTDEAQYKSTIFELRCPRCYSAWRDITWMILQDLGRATAVQCAPLAMLFNYAGLEPYAEKRSSRLGFASTTKSFLVSHYKAMQFPVSLKSLYVNNALQYKLHDRQGQSWVANEVDVPSLQSKCITRLPSGPYANLQYAVDSTDHEQNKVIADQESCSRDISIHEYIAFGSLRAEGERVQ